MAEFFGPELRPFTLPCHDDDRWEASFGFRSDFRVLHISNLHNHAQQVSDQWCLVLEAKLDRRCRQETLNVSSKHPNRGRNMHGFELAIMGHMRFWYLYGSRGHWRELKIDALKPRHPVPLSNTCLLHPHFFPNTYFSYITSKERWSQTLMQHQTISESSICLLVGTEFIISRPQKAVATLLQTNTRLPMSCEDVFCCKEDPFIRNWTNL